jgi:hypothetical protein
MKAVGNAMSNKEPAVIAALDGTESETGPRLPSNTEPKALFFVMFGLVFETLLDTSVEATSSAAMRDSAVIALQALQSLVRPEFSGKALLEQTVFTEFTSLCYRMAITESAKVQLHLISVIIAFAQTQRVNIKDLDT